MSTIRAATTMVSTDPDDPLAAFDALEVLGELEGVALYGMGTGMTAPGIEHPLEHPWDHPGAEEDADSECIEGASGLRVRL